MSLAAGPSLTVKVRVPACRLTLPLPLMVALGAAEADLLSYVYFDRCYADHLIDLGRRDAEARSGELLAFFS